MTEAESRERPRMSQWLTPLIGSVTTYCCLTDSR